MPHISVCICAYKRPHFLKRLLEVLADLDTGQLFTYSIVVVDNDRAQSSHPVVTAFAAVSSVPVSYFVQPQQNIALTRNTAIEHAKGDFIAFIDDDEYPTRCWLQYLFETCTRYEADGALGPVKPQFADVPPAWVLDAGFYHRPTYSTGFVIDWRDGRTGNVLINRRILAAEAEPFKPEFLSGEDTDFFRRMIGKGHVFVWCNEAVVYETVPVGRWRRTFMLRRALMRGRMSLLHPTGRPLAIAKSAVAVPAYLAALPFALVTGQSRFMVCLVKLFDHAGRLLALFGLNPVREPYVTD